jgi:hypothetical protein
VLSPFLLFVVLAEADVRTLFSALLPVSAIAAVSRDRGLRARLAVRLATSAGEVMIGALSAGQVNRTTSGIRCRSTFSAAPPTPHR